MNNPVVAEIGKKIRKVRHDRSLTVQQLADRAGVSKGLISRIENNRTVPSLPVLISIIKGLEVEISLFFEDIDQKNEVDQYQVFRKKDLTPRIFPDHAGLEELDVLNRRFTDYTLQTIIKTLVPNSRGKASTTDGVEYNFILDGEAVFEIGSQLIHLQEEDSILFDGQLNYCPVNQSNEKVRMLVISMVIPGDKW